MRHFLTRPDRSFFVVEVYKVGVVGGGVQSLWELSSPLRGARHVRRRTRPLTVRGEGVDCGVNWVVVDGVICLLVCWQGIFFSSSGVEWWWCWWGAHVEGVQCPWGLWLVEGTERGGMVGDCGVRLGSLAHLRLRKKK